MIGTSTPEYVLIRTCIIGIRAITPLSILYCVSLPFQPHRLPYFLGIWPIAETAFYFLVYLPRRWFLQRPTIHPYVLPQPERKELFKRCMEHMSDPIRYLEKWCKDAPLSEIKRENVKDFYRWAFLNSKTSTSMEEVELEEYVDKFEEYSRLNIEPGYGRAQCLRLTLDPVDMVHRPLVWYLIVFAVDNFTHLSLLYHGFKYYRTSLIRFPTVFPPRPLTLLTASRSPVKVLTYWLRPHTSTTKLPILFLHGVGIGLLTYIDFLSSLNKDQDDGEVGIIAVEILPVSFRITHAALESEDMVRQIQNVLMHHGFDKFVLVTHSYGSFIATSLLKDAVVSEQISSVVLIDPPTIMLHLPDVAYNFTYRKPCAANDWQLWYFACKDMGVAHTLARAFFWSENILWKEDISDKSVSIFLGGRDLIVNTKEVARYLTGLYGNAEEGREEDGSWNEGKEEWIAADGRMKVVWGEELDHAQIFDSKKRLPGLVEEVLKHSRGER